MRLRANRETDPQVLDALNESQSRVMAMAQVHEALYRSESLAEIDLLVYLRTLADTLPQLYPLAGRGVRISLDAAPDIRLGIDQAVPCGLVINELLSNAIKHAFPEGRGGEAVIKAGRREDGALEIDLRDNGVGLPPGFDWRASRSMGLSLVRGLVEDQLRGAIETFETKGTWFRIVVPPAA